MSQSNALRERIHRVAALRRGRWGEYWPDRTLADVFTEQAARYAGKRAVVDRQRDLSYAQLDEVVARCANVLHGLGVGTGDVVVSQLPNWMESTALLIAAARLGAVHAPVVHIYGARELRFVLEQTRAPVLVVPRKFRGVPHADIAHRLAAEVETLRHVVVVDEAAMDGPLFAAPPRMQSNASSPDDPIVVLYTSGTTGVAKGVVHTSNTLLAECTAVQRYHQLTADEVFVMPSPVSHMSGLLYGILVPMYLGAAAVLMDNWDPTEFLELVVRYGGTFSGGATPFLQGVADHPSLTAYDISTFRVFPCGGADVPPDLVPRAVERLGVRSGRGYGSTEFPSITSSSGLDEPMERRGLTDGRPIGPNQIELRDLDDRLVEAGEEGEIWAQGPELFLGYFDETLDAETFDENGWYRTGDLGVVDADGYLTITGRLKDVIVRGGEKFAAREIEELLLTHPKVAQVAVVGAPDAALGERVCAFVVPRQGSDPPELAELCAHLATAELSKRKHPERLEIVAELPMTKSGKVQKHVLKQQLTSMVSS